MKFQFFLFFYFFFIFFFWGGGGGSGRCERRSEVFVKVPKNIYFFFFFWGGGRVGGGSGWGVRVDLNREVKLL